MKVTLKLLLALIGVFAVSLVAFYTVYGAFMVFNKGERVVFHFEKSDDLASWIQAVTSFAAIMASAYIAIHIQRADHRNQRKTPIEVAITIAGYCVIAVTKMKQGTISLEELRKSRPGDVLFDLDGVQAMAKLTAELPVFELRSGDAVNHLLSLRHTMRQLSAYAMSLSGHYQDMSENAFKEHHVNLDDLFERILRSEKGLERALREIG